MLDDVIKILDYLPTAGNNRSIAVGFENIDALAPLKMILDDYFNKIVAIEDKKYKDTNNQSDKRHKKNLEEWSKLIDKVLNSQDSIIEENNKSLKRLQDANEENNKEMRELNKTIKTDKKDDKEYKQYLIRALSVALKVADKHFENAVKMGNTYVDIESSGVFLKNGFNELGDTANKLGMTYDDLASHLKKTSPLIARLNGTMGNGLKSFESAVGNIDDRLNLTNKERVSIFENVLNNLSPDQLMRMSQEQLNFEVNKTAKEMKMLSMATGKSVELINQENAQKARTLRENVWKRTHKQAYSVLQSLGITEDSELMDYIMSGGGKMTAGILTKMQNDPFMQRMLPMLTRSAMTNNLNSQTLASLYQQNAYLATFKSGYADRASFDPSKIMASGASDLFQNTQFFDFYDSYFKNANLNGDMASQYFSPARAGANDALGSHIGLVRARDRYDSNLQTAYSGGEQGVKNVGKLGAMLYNSGSWLINKYNSIASGTLGGMVASGIKVGSDTLFAASVYKFGKYVDKLTGPTSSSPLNDGLMSFGGSVKDFSLGGSWRGLKNSNGKWQIPFKSTPWKSLSNAAKFGKVAGGVGSVLTAGVGAYDTIQNYDTLKKEGKLSESIGSNIGTLIGGIGGTILGGPVGAIFGSWLGDKVGGLAGKGIGWASDKISNWWNNDNKTEIKTPSNSQINHLNDSQNYTSKNMKLLEDSVLYSKRTSESIQQLIDKAVEGNKIQEMKITYDKTKGEHQN